jgi:hypothetical protein
MLVKPIETSGIDKYGESTERIVWTPDMSGIEKFASDSTVHDKVKEFISAIKPVEKHTFKLLTALGAYEFWGQNRNGDRFSETGRGDAIIAALMLPGPKYGYTSFMTSGCYRHHVNKNPNITLGKVVFSFYNPIMHRVELVIDYDHALLERHNAMDYLGLTNPDYSMAARVPWDRCSACCDNDEYRKALATAKSTSPEDQVAAVLAYIKIKPIKGLATKRENYCEHLKYMMNEVLPGGRQIGSWNDFPSFFDISQVTTGAAIEAKEMRKLASVESAIERYERMLNDEPEEEIVQGRSQVGFVKAASLAKESLLTRQASIMHRAEMDKTIEAMGVPLSVSMERKLPDSLLDQMPFSEALSSAGSLGIALQPQEFQRMVLSSIGESNLADDLEFNRIIFPRPVDRIKPPMGEEYVRPELVKSLLPFVENRSFFSPPATKRLAVVILARRNGEDLSPEVSSEAPYRELAEGSLSDRMKMVSSLYHGYRDELAQKIVCLLRCACKLPEVREALWGDSASGEDTLDKHASVPPEMLALGSLFPIMYLYSGHLKKEEQDGEKLGMIREFIKKHPVISALGVASLLQKLLIR